ncbi:hypothetical protein RHOER0001_6748 [Rhodococcus erythropolis SK121]|nr:hypothetical protein RHOER0001_6748 [Rhodococcus erythropolis SK121]
MTLHTIRPVRLTKNPKPSRHRVDKCASHDPHKHGRQRKNR